LLIVSHFYSINFYSHIKMYVWFSYSMDWIYRMFWISIIIVLFVLWLNLCLFYSYFYLYLLISILFWFDEWYIHMVCIFCSATNGAQLISSNQCRRRGIQRRWWLMLLPLPWYQFQLFINIFISNLKICKYCLCSYSKVVCSSIG
jgi:hypothetical protein